MIGNRGFQRNKVVMRSVLAGVSAFAILPQAIAQTSADDESGQDATARLSTVVVTSQKREESLQDVPISITAFTGDVVESAGATDITSLNGLAPNVRLQTEGLIPNVPSTSIRGISQGDPDPNSDPKISTVIDGVYIPYVAGTMLDLFDIERVEVLKGPQGTLFGKNNIGGTINVVTKRPADDFGGEIRLTAGENGHRQARARMDTGLFANDTLSAKLAVNFREYGGYSTNILTGSDLNTQDVSAFRGAVKFEPNSSFNSTIIVDTIDEETVGPAGHTVDNGDPRYDLIPQKAREDIRVSAVAFDPYANTETTGLAWETNFDTGNGVLTSVIGYRELSYVTRGDFDGFTVPEPGLDVIRAMDSDASSIELRYASPIGDGFDYVLGVFASNDTFVQDNTVRPAPGVDTASTLEQDTTSLAAFAQANVYLNEDWTLTLGGRYTHDEKDYSIDSKLFIGGNIIPPSSFSNTFNETWSNFNPRVALEYSPTDDMMVYGSYSTGYKGGGFNSRGTTAENVGPYGEETITAYEIGTKNDLMNGRFRINLAAFYNDYKDVQGSTTRQGAARPENVTANIADIETYGAEAEMQWLPTNNLTLALNFALLDASYTDFCADVDGVFTNGAPEPNQCGNAEPIMIGGVPTGTFSVPVDNTSLDVARAPENSGSFIVDYNKPLNFGILDAHIDFRYSASQNTWGRDNRAAFYRDAVVMVNGNIAFSTLNRNWRVMLYARNLTDEDVLAAAINAGANTPIQFYQPPREVGVEVSYKF